MNRIHLGSILAAAGLAAWCGCSCSRVPSAPERPKLSPADAAQKAMAEYDANGDTFLTLTELEKSPPLLWSMERIDVNQDDMLTATEIAARIESWEKAPVIIVGGHVQFTLDGQPLAGATVTLEPEKFLGPAYQSETSQTNQFGETSFQGSQEQYSGIYLGFYRLRVSKKVGGQETIPAKYNTETTLGFEAADDIPGLGVTQFDLTSR